MSTVYLNLQDFIMRIESLIIYKNILKDPVIKSLHRAARCILAENEPAKTYKGYTNFLINLVSVAEKLGLSGNIFSKYVVYVFLKDVNMFSLACEKHEDISDSTLKRMAKYEIGVMNFMIGISIKDITDFIGYELDIINYKPLHPKIYEEIDQFINESNFTKNFNHITSYYENIGCGALGSGKVFRYNEKEGLVNIESNSQVSMKNIFGHAKQKEALIENFNAFIENKKASNLLLVGIPGSGQSMLITAILNEYSSRGLRVVKVGRREAEKLQNILDIVSERGKKVIIYFDDISATSLVNEFKDLKFIMDNYSHVENSNIIFCASYYVHNNEDKFIIDNNEQIPESIESVAYIFDKTLYLPSISEEDFLKIVLNISKAEKFVLDEDFLLSRAKEWVKNINFIRGKDAVEFIEFIKQEISNI